MNLNKNAAFVLTLFVDFILLMLGAGTIAFLNVGGVFVFLIEFYFIRFIHRNVYNLLTKGTGTKNNVHNNTIEAIEGKNIEHSYSYDSKVIIVDKTDNVQETFNVKSETIKHPLQKFATINKTIRKRISVAIISIIGLVVITLILTAKPSEKKFGGYLYPIYENGLYGYIDSVGNKIIKPQFLWCSTFSNNRALVVTDTIFREVDDSIKYLSGESDTVEKKYRLYAKYGYIDRSGKFVLPAKYICYVNMLKDESNHDIKRCSHVFQQYTFRNGRALVYDTLSWKIGYIDKNGSVVIPQKYYYAEPFSDSIAIVYEKTGKPEFCNNVLVVSGYLRAGYIDVNGEPITECKFESLTTFVAKRGIGKITEMNSIDGDFIDSYSVHNIILNEKGEAVDTLSMLNRYYDYSPDGIAVSEQVMFSNIDEIKNGPSYEYVTKNGKFLRPLEGLSQAYQAYLGKRKDIVQVWPKDLDMVDVTYFQNGLAGVTPDHEHWYFIDKYLVVHGDKDNPAFENIKGFGNSLCPVKKNGKWGYVNRKIEEVIPFKYDSCGVAYPYLEEAFDLNIDGTINKKYWINRFDSVVWESAETETITNKYVYKNRDNWGKWSQKDTDVSYKLDTRYVYALIGILLMALVIYFSYRHEYKDFSFKKKYVTIPLALCSISLCMICTHCIFKYLFGDYCNISEYSIKNTPNIKRKNSINYQCVKYQDERFRCKDSIGVQPKHTKWLEFGIGVLPSGKYISTYVGSNTDRYFAGNREVERHSQRLVPKYKTINYGYGIKDTYQDGWKWEDYSYVDYEPVYFDYTWHYALSTFDISDKLSIFCNEDSVYSEYLKDIEKQLTANYGYKFVYTNVNGKKALRYTTYDGTPIKRVIFCANGRAYIVETKSIDKLNEHSEEACSKVILKNFDIAEKDNRFISSSILGLIIGIVILTIIIIWYYSGDSYNKKAHTLYVCSLLSMGINVIICCCLIYSAYVLFYITVTNAIILILALISCLVISVPLIGYYKHKELNESSDFIIPTWIQKHIYCKISSDVYRKLFISFVIYPLMVFSLIPCGIITLAYSIPALLVSFAILFVSKWKNWVINNNKPTEKIETSLKDYYSILNVPKNATQTEINIAYNSRMSFFGQSTHMSTFDKKEFGYVQEAYKILSTPRLKNLYDVEYTVLQSENNFEELPIENKELEDSILNIRREQGGGEGSKRLDSFNRIFFFVVIIITSIVFIVKCASEAKGQNSIGNAVVNTFFNTVGIEDSEDYSDSDTDIDSDCDYETNYDY